MRDRFPLTEFPIRERFESLIQGLRKACIAFYRNRLVSLVVFGSVGRKVMQPDSDIDFLLVLDPLPVGRMARVDEFRAVEDMLRSTIAEAARAGVHTELSPVFKTPVEVRRGSPLFLDMVDDARILFDRDEFFRKEMDRLQERLRELGATRIWKGSAWYWDLKPDYSPGDVFEV